MRTWIVVVAVFIAAGVWWFVADDGASTRAGGIDLVDGPAAPVVGAAGGAAAAAAIGEEAELLDVAETSAGAADASSTDNPSERTPSPSAGSRVVGTVVFDAHDEPVVGATVVAHVRAGNERLAFRGETDDEGRYAIDVDVARPVALRGLEILAGARWPQRFERTWRVTLEPGEEHTRDVRMPAPIALSGMVVDTDDAPIVGATVRAWSVGPGRLAATDLVGDAVETESDTSGRFRLEGVGPSFTLTGETADLVGHVTLVSRNDTTLDRIDDLRLVLSSARTVRGRVVDASGRDVGGARVEILLDRPSFAPPSSPVDVEGPLAVTATSSDDGAFVLERVASRELDVVVEAEGFPEWKGTHAPGDPDLIVRLASGAQLSGHVFGADGQAVAGAYVMFKPSRFAKRHETETDAMGFFALGGLPDVDEGVFGVRDDDHAVFVREPMAVAQADPAAPLEIVLQPEREVAGVVVDAQGAPVEGAIVTIEGERVIERFRQRPLVTWEYLLAEWRVETGADGAFVFDRLYDGVYVVTLEHPDDTTLRVSHEVVASATDLRFVLDPDVTSGVTFRGRVTDAFTGAPIPAFGVAVMEPDATGGPSGWVMPFEAEDGSYQLTGRRPGVKHLSFSADGYNGWQSEKTDYDVGEYVVDAALRPHRALHLRVVDEEGAPVEGARASFSTDEQQWIMVPAGQAMSLSSHIATDADGLLTATELPATEVHVEVESPDRDAIVDTTVDLTFPQTGVHEVVLADSNLVEIQLIVVARGSAAEGDLEWPPPTASAEERGLDLMAKLQAGVVVAPPGDESMSVTVRDADDRWFSTRSSTPVAIDGAAPMPSPRFSRVRAPAEPVTIIVSLGDDEASVEWAPGDGDDDTLPTLIVVL